MSDLDPQEPTPVVTLSNNDASVYSLQPAASLSVANHVHHGESTRDRAQGVRRLVLSGDANGAVHEAKAAEAREESEVRHAQENLQQVLEKAQGFLGTDDVEEQNTVALKEAEAVDVEEAIEEEDGKVPEPLKEYGDASYAYKLYICYRRIRRLEKRLQSMRARHKGGARRF